MSDRFFVTTPIYYVNDAPHIGHAYTTTIADSLARWNRLLGKEVFFLTGTDEHGLKVQRSAEEAGVTPQEQADHNSARFREVWDSLGISYDDFIRTSEPRHHKAVQALMQAAYDNGYIEKGLYEGLYCVACEAYYDDDDLVDGNCPIHNRPVEFFSEENYFFKLSAFQERLEEWLTSSQNAVIPDGKRAEALGLVRQGLRDVSVTRTSIDWGIPVPWAPGHVFYVWYDALINYATAVGYGDDDEKFAKWWPHTLHLLAKDILRFHCVYWPAMLMAAGIEPLPHFAVHGFLLLGGEKLSKTVHGPARLTDIAPSRLVEEFGVDGFRYHLLRDTPFGPDGDFSHERMVARYNADLANNLGNLLSRVTKVVQTKCQGVGPAPDPASPLAEVVASAYVDAERAWANVAPSVALEATWRIVHETNAYLEANEPWKAEPGPEVEAVLGNALEALRVVAIMATPAIPTTSAAIWQRIGLTGTPEMQTLPAAATWGQYPGGLTLQTGDGLFPRIKPNE